MSKSGYSLDFLDFNKGIGIYQKLVEQEAAPEGVEKALDALIDDVKTLPPRIPHRDGALEGSCKVDKVEREGDAIIGQMSVGEGATGADAPYAVKWHELPPDEARKINWTRAGSGAKYIESKLNWFRGKYLGIIASVIKKRAG